jgi:hypothetical protein
MSEVWLLWVLLTVTVHFQTRLVSFVPRLSFFSFYQQNLFLLNKLFVFRGLLKLFVPYVSCSTFGDYCF